MANEIECLAKVGNPVPELLTFEVIVEPDRGGLCRFDFSMRRTVGSVELFAPVMLKRKGFSDMAVCFYDESLPFPGQEPIWRDGF